MAARPKLHYRTNNWTLVFFRIKSIIRDETNNILFHYLKNKISFSLHTNSIITDTCDSIVILKYYSNYTLLLLFVFDGRIINHFNHLASRKKQVPFRMAIENVNRECFQNTRAWEQQE